MMLSKINARSFRVWLAGLAAGASLTVLAVAAPSHAVIPSPTPAPAPSSSTMSTASSLADVVERVSPSVVQIMARETTPMVSLDEDDGDGLPPEFRDFFGRDFQFFFRDRRGWEQKRPDRLAAGSGFFVQGGYIVTNNHVVENATKLKVRLDDGTEAEAKLVGADAKTDLAVIKVDPKHTRKPLSWGDSERSRIGDSVFTIGAPYSLGNTVTAGIISARGRDISSGPYDDYLQIDAPINPGNSGGPMFNAAGEVIGVNTAIYSPSGGNVGIGFSIPSDQAQVVVKQIIEKGFVERGWLGVSIQKLTPEIAQSLNLTDAKGAFVADVTTDSPAAKAGLKPMDVIIAYGDRPIRQAHDLTRAVAETRPGDSRDVKFYRDGQLRTISVRISELKSPVDLSPSAKKSTKTARKVSLDGGLGLQLGEDGQGMVVLDVESGSAAEEAGLRRGDRLLKMELRDVTSGEDVQRAVDLAKSGGRRAVLVQVERAGAKLFVGVPVSAL